MIVFKKVKHKIGKYRFGLCENCDITPIECEKIFGKSIQQCKNGATYKKLSVKNVVVIDGIAYKDNIKKYVTNACNDCNHKKCKYFNKCYIKLGKVVQHVNTNK